MRIETCFCNFNDEMEILWIDFCFLNLILTI